MPDPTPRLTPQGRVSAPRGATTALLAGAAALFLAAGLLAGRALDGDTADRCSPPPGIELRALSPGARDRLAERAMSCADLERGRITAAEYRAVLGALARRPASLRPSPDLVWASSVRAVSSQYSADSWSASQALGPPDAFPAGADSPQAWASTDADSGAEFLELDFAGQHRMSGIEVVESFNPGALARVELILAGGERALVHDGRAEVRPQSASRRRVEFDCTEQPVVGVRITLDSHQVSGWNEIDAVGGVPCDD